MALLKASAGARRRPSTATGSVRRVLLTSGLKPQVSSLGCLPRSGSTRQVRPTDGLEWSVTQTSRTPLAVICGVTRCVARPRNGRGKKPKPQEHASALEYGRAAARSVFVKAAVRAKARTAAVLFFRFVGRSRPWPDMTNRGSPIVRPRPDLQNACRVPLSGLSSSASITGVCCAAARGTRGWALTFKRSQSSANLLLRRVVVPSC